MFLYVHAVPRSWSNKLWLTPASSMIEGFDMALLLTQSQMYWHSLQCKISGHPSAQRFSWNNDQQLTLAKSCDFVSCKLIKISKRAWPFRNDILLLQLENHRLTYHHVLLPASAIYYSRTPHSHQNSVLKLTVLLTKSLQNSLHRFVLHIHTQ